MSGASPVANPKEFSRRGYRELLHTFLEAGYEVATFRDAETTASAPPLILRHDLDIDPTLGIAIGEIEASCAVQSTFLVLLTSPLYNPATPANLACLHELLEQGHEVGIHFDASPFDTIEQRDQALGEQAQMLGDLLSAPIRVASFHRPGPATDHPGLPGVVSAYEPRFVQDMSYFADSGGTFRHGHPLESTSFLERRGIQLLTHPIWWSHAPLHDVTERLDAWHARHQLRLRNTLAANIRPYADHVTSTREHNL